MRLAARSGQSLLEQRREQPRRRRAVAAEPPEATVVEEAPKPRRRRAAAGTLDDQFPAVARIRVELSFPETVGPAPARQLHDMYPPAPAYFDFACPYGDCDGGFDLNKVAASLMKNATPHVDGTIDCSGNRVGMTRLPCNLRAHYRIAAEYQKAGVKR